MRRACVWAFALLAGCAGEARTEPQRPSAAVEPVDEPVDEPAPTASAAVDAPAPEEPAEPRFDVPFPETPCPEVVEVRLAHATTALPPILGHALAMRSEDRRQLRVVIADRPIETDAAGRFVPPSTGGARFEMDARRTRRGALDPRVLGAPDAARGGLTHVRVVTPEARLTFGHRDIGTVELTAIEDDRICGRIALDDGFTRVRGAFRAQIVGPLPP